MERVRERRLKEEKRYNGEIIRKGKGVEKDI